MKKGFTILLLLLSLAEVYAQTEFTTSLFDSRRYRIVPVAVYRPKKESARTGVIIFNHGYDGDKNDKSNQSYSYLTRFLAEKGYYVISIQHELSDDPLLAMEGNFMETRMPNCKRGEENILFTIQEFKKLKPDLQWENLCVIGHSNGGDITMLTATDHPELIMKAISMDHRRMIIPRTQKPRIYTLRGCDYDADPGVLPTSEEQQKFLIEVVRLNGVTHSNMGENGSAEQHDLINRHIYMFLNN